MRTKHYVIENGKLRDFPDAEYADWLADPEREGRQFYHGAEGKKLAERILEHGDELEALQADGKERLLAAGLSEEEYDIWHYGAYNVADTKKLEAAMRRIR